MENMTKEQELTEAKKFLHEKIKEYPPFAHGGLNQLPYLFIPAVAKCMEEFVQFSLYKDHPTTASGSVAAPKEEERKNPEYYIDQYVTLRGIVEDEYGEIVHAMRRYADQELASLRQELEQREEALKELLTIAQEDKSTGISLAPELKEAIIERAHKLLTK